MSKLSLIDKLNVLIETTVSSNLHIIAILILIVLGMALIETTKKNEKRNKIIYLTYTTFVIVFVSVSYHASLGNMFSYMMNNFFIAVYFPNLAIYLAAIIITNIIVFISIFYYKTSTPIKNLNIVVYTLMNYLLLLVLTVVNKNSLDIFNKQSVYENKEALALIELSSTIFMIWIIFLIVYKIILIYLKKDYKPKVKKVIVRKKIKKLPDNYQPLNIPDYVYGNIPNKETIIVNENNTVSKEFESRFTLDEYKLFSKILKEQKNKNDLEKEKISLKEELSQIDIVDDKEEQEDFTKNRQQEKIKIEEDRKELLRLATEKQQEENNIQSEEEYVEPIKKEYNQYVDNQITFKDENDYEIEDKEQAKLTELERLYQSIR